MLCTHLALTAECEVPDDVEPAHVWDIDDNPLSVL